MPRSGRRPRAFPVRPSKAPRRGPSLIFALLFGLAATLGLAAPAGAFPVAPPASSPAAAGQAVDTPEGRTARYYASIRGQPLLLAPFLRAFPKGGDIHNHLSGAVYAETYIEIAVSEGFCIVVATYTLAPPPCDAAAGRPPVSDALRDSDLYNAIIDAWSMRAFVPGVESGHDHFFNTFGKFGLASARQFTGIMLAEVAARAAAQNELYLELMFGLDGGTANRVADAVGWVDDFEAERERLLAGGLADAVGAARQILDAAEADMRARLRCGTPAADPGCRVTVRYLYQANREQPPQRVFAQFLAAFLISRADGRVVGLNFVAPEDGYIAMRDYRLHMSILDYLYRLDPRMNIALHAGELAPGRVPPEGLRFHIREAVERGHAKRIGHGVDIMYEDDPFALLGELATRRVLIEIALSSNDLILGVRGAQHPFPIYLRAGVPVTLATDDEGVARSDLSREYLRAATTYDLSYPDLKRLARNSLEYSFLPGESLWASAEAFTPVAACAPALATPVARADPPAPCHDFLAANERARLEWDLEVAFAAFESGY